MLKTPEILASYFDTLTKRMTVANSMEPDLERWRDLARAHNAPAPAERFAEPIAQPAAAAPASADAVAGEIAAMLPAQLGTAMPGVTAAPPPRESKLKAQRRWRTAAITAMLQGKRTVQAAPLLTEMQLLRDAEAQLRGVDSSGMHPHHNHGALKTWLCQNKVEWRAYATVDSDGGNMDASSGGEDDSDDAGSDFPDD